MQLAAPITVRCTLIFLAYKIDIFAMSYDISFSIQITLRICVLMAMFVS